MPRVLLYAEVDLNLIDGSSIWLVSLTEVLAGASDVEITILQRTRLERDVVVERTRTLPNVTYLDPWELAATDREIAQILSANGGSRLRPAVAAELIGILDRGRPFSWLIVRGLDVAELLARQPGLGARMWAYVTDPKRHTSQVDVARLRTVFDVSAHLLCQTQEARDAFVDLLQCRDTSKLFVLPPMIPEPNGIRRPPLDPRAPRLGYSGKLAPGYMILEMLDAFERIRESVPGAEFHVVGDKIHNAPPVPGFVETLANRLKWTSGVVWHGGTTREQAHEILGGGHVAASWRAPIFDDSLEMSTKVLEYASLGMPVLMNPSLVQRRIFGDDYPAYVRSGDEFVERFLGLVRSPERYSDASRHVADVAGEYTFPRALQRLQPLLTSAEPPMVRPTRTSLLFAGHDFKFLGPLLSHVAGNEQYDVLRDEYSGHSIADPARSESLLRDAKVVFCEWCLGNAEWYSKHKRDDQKLVIRFHLQELDTPYAARVCWENVDRVVFICPLVRDRFLERFPQVADRAALIYNLIDAAPLDQPKLARSEFNLGLLGSCPRRKAPHLAVEILERLKQHDRRYTLFFKGKRPEEFGWLWRRPEEREYYDRLNRCLAESPYADSVVFEPHGDDVSAWFSRIGFILSTSDFEGSHQAVAEGMAAGCIPVIRNWAGADAIYPGRFVFSSVDEAVERIIGWRKPGVYLEQSQNCRSYARQHFDQTVITRQYDELFSQLLEAA
ncbi:MAG: glycosyltransferase [Gemmatimonas sp.]|nr:glycosyltransferase [Gemmatimonas sp.]